MKVSPSLLAGLAGPGARVAVTSPAWIGIFTHKSLSTEGCFAFHVLSENQFVKLAVKFKLSTTPLLSLHYRSAVQICRLESNMSDVSPPRQDTGRALLPPSCPKCIKHIMGIFYILSYSFNVSLCFIFISFDISIFRQSSSSLFFTLSCEAS